LVVNPLIFAEMLYVAVGVVLVLAGLLLEPPPQAARASVAAHNTELAAIRGRNAFRI
jgi:uncharacterized protein YjeT (DUF2065 family)